MSDFSDLSMIPSPLKSELGSTKSKKRGIGSQSTGGRLRLLPIDSSSNSPCLYEVGNQNNNNTNQSNGPNTSTLAKIKRITQKRELLEAVRKANAPIIISRELLGRDGATSITRHEGNASSIVSVTNDAAALEDEAARKDIEYLEDGVHTNARKYNEHKLMADKRQRELNSLLDELRSLQLETETLSRMQNHETPIAKQSERIRNEIQECTVSMEEQTHQRRQLEHMVRRLQTSQLKIDIHLEAMAKAVEGSHHEAEEVKLLCRQLEAGKSRAVQVLQDVHLQVQMDRKTRARELNDHEIRARNAQKMEVWRLQRMQERAEMAAELRGDLSSEEEQRLIQNIESRERANEALHLANLTKSQTAADYEDVLEQLKVAMGADSLQQVVEKILAQASTNASLEKEKTQTEARVIAVRHDKEHCLQSLNELKASGIGGMELNREVYNTLEKEIQQAKATLKVNKAAYERLDGVIQSVRQGTFGLAQRLQAFDDALDWSNTESALLAASSTSNIDSGSSDSQSRIDQADSLVLAELKLSKMLELVAQPVSTVNAFGSFGNSGNGMDEEDDEEGEETSTSMIDYADDRNTLWSPTVNSDPVLHRNNIRIQPVVRRTGGIPIHHPFALDYLASPINSARSDISSSSDVDQLADVHVPSRDILKMSSSRHYSEVMRKKEMTEKHKVATERGISDEEMISKLKKKNQLEADTRLSTSPSKSSGVSLKEEKSFAFVTQLQFNEIG